MPAVQQSQSQLSVERERVRDLLRYYKPNVKRLQTALPHRSLCEDCHETNSSSDAAFDAPPPSIAVAAEAADDAPDDAPDDSKLLSHDPTLTAFAQLGAFRLNCQRSFISLMDHENQYILAEATRSVGLNDQTVCDSGDEIYLGARVLDMVWGVCPNTIQVFTAKDGHLNVNTPLICANQECYVMNDLSAIENFKSRPYVAGWPYMRFYAEVPIQSPTGFVIGTYCVVDDKPRDGLDKKGLDALNEISSAIMKHLELIQMQHNLRRAGEMVKGLGMFVEGKIDPSQQWVNDEGTALGSLEKIPGMTQIGTAETLSTVSEGKGTAPQNIDRTPITTSTASPPPKLFDEPGVIPQAGDMSTSGIAFHPRERKLSLNDGAVRQESLASAGIKNLFSRACYLIRDALDLEGVLFVDAFFRDIAVDPADSAPTSIPESLRFGGMPGTPASDRSEWPDSKSAAPMTTSNVVPNSGSVVHARAEGDHLSSSSELLGRSVKSATCLGGQSSLVRHVPLSQSTLRGLLKKYRNGHTFVFNEDGSVVIQDAKETAEAQLSEIQTRSPTAEVDRGDEMVWTKQLLEMCPGARSITFFPLWDPQRDQWFAGSLAWTIDPTRIIQSEDVSYLAAFGSCIMSEKSRLDALTADLAKADFISSVSHELRSPLRGVLASAEALRETSTGLMQDDMIRTITVCGEVLLDTMDQILDYAKTSHSPSPIMSKLQPKLPLQPKKAVEVDLSFLVESVVEGIFAGHNSRKMPFRSLDGEGQLKSGRPATVAMSSEDVMIILSMDRQDSWIYHSQPGGWKRILMNVFGNALKYTRSGFILVSLNVKITPASPTLPEQRVVALQIDDSGIGMSKDYLKYQLFTPFAQENHLSVGTGLGLSIVRQLVTDLGGKIDVQSEVGYGTTVKVSVPLDSPPQSSDSVSLECKSLISDTERRSRGLTLCLVGFDYYPDIGENPTGILHAHARRMLALKSSLATIATDWFAMEVFTASSLTSAKGDILVGFRSNMDLADGHTQNQALIIFEDAVRSSRTRDAKGVYSLFQPVGPYKMARVLGLCLDYRSSVAANHHDLSGYNNFAGNLGMPSENTLFGKMPTIDRHSTASPENVPAETSHSQALPKPVPSLPNSREHKVENIAADSMILTFSHRELAATSSLPRSKILLVEDNAINMKILVQYMQKANQDYVTAVDGLEALQRFQADPRSFRVIFMDLSMPVMDGLSSCRIIRSYELENSLPRTRIVALTCFSSPEYQREAVLSGFDLFLVKPVPMKTLRPILDLDPETFPVG